MIRGREWTCLREATGAINKYQLVTVSKSTGSNNNNRSECKTPPSYVEGIGMGAHGNGGSTGADAVVGTVQIVHHDVEVVVVVLPYKRIFHVRARPQRRARPSR